MAHFSAEVTETERIEVKQEVIKVSWLNMSGFGSALTQRCRAVVLKSVFVSQAVTQVVGRVAPNYTLSSGW